jgi:glycosyltransferase involved in cell wall biosynthesis
VTVEPVLRLSVVIPVKDDARELARCLAALSTQTATVFEIIVVDNNSADESAGVAARFGATVVHERMPGIAAAASAGYDYATGDLIGRLDADSVPASDWAHRIAVFFATQPNASAVTGGAMFIDGPRRLRGIGAALYLGAYFVLVGAALGHTPLFGSNFAMRSRAWRRVSPEVHRADLLIHDDMDLSYHLGPVASIRFSARLRVGISSRPLSDGNGALRIRRALHTIALHWPGELPWLRILRRSRRHLRESANVNP